MGYTCCLERRLALLDVPVLEPDLHYPHVQARVLRQLLTHMSGGFRTIVVGGFQCLQLLGRDRGAGSLVGLITVQGAIQVETCGSEKSLGSTGSKDGRGAEIEERERERVCLPFALASS